MSDYPPTPVLTAQTPPFRQDRVLCAMHELSPAQGDLLESKVPHGQLRPAVLQHTVAFLPAPDMSAWSDTRGRDSDSGRHRLELSAGAVCPKRRCARASIRGA